ncbi:hypothetical protein PRIC1_013301 [Phytophthora ramorum]
MGRKKSPVTRKRIGRRYVDPAANSSSSSASEASSLLDDVSRSSLRGLAANKQDPMDTESSDSFQLPSPPFRGLHTTLPIGGEAPRGRKSRRNSGDDDAISRRREADSSEEEEAEEEEVVTIPVSELEKWQQRVIFHVEDHFTNEQLKRIAEFGRVHGSIVQEAKQYVANMEIQLTSRLEEERAALRAEAEEFVAKTTADNESLRHQVEDLEQQVEGLEREVDELKLEKTQGSRQHDEDQQRNSEHLQQTHSPPNHRRQVQPGNGEVNEDGENKPTNGTRNTNGYQVDERGGFDQLLAPKQTPCGPVEHCSTSKTTNLPPHHEVHADLDKAQCYQRQQRPANSAGSPAGETQSNPGLASNQERFQMIESPNTPAGAGE